MTGMLAAPIAQVTTPSLAPPAQQLSQARGTCTLNAPGVGVLTFRTNPNEITWDYNLITHVEETYGGRVIQILGTKIDNLTVKVDCGQGGWNYAMYVVNFMRDLMVQQRNGQPATFTYTTRSWNLNVFAANVPFHDSVQETVRELTLQFQIQEDISGIQTSASLDAALQGMQDGIGWIANSFNNASFTGGAFTGANNTIAGAGGASALQTTTNAILPTAATGPTNVGIPGVSSVFTQLGSLLGI
jgi:hypothetical protein